MDDLIELLRDVERWQREDLISRMVDNGDGTCTIYMRLPKGIAERLAKQPAHEIVDMEARTVYHRIEGEQ